MTAKVPPPQPVQPDMPITMFEEPWEWLVDLLRTFVWWSGIIALLILIGVAAGVTSGFLT